MSASASASAGHPPPETKQRVDHRPISRTKVTPAIVREPTLSRTRLLNWLEDNITRRVILIVAEAGYGKTTLLADFSRRTAAQCFWYRLDTTDRDWVTFVTYLIASVREAISNFGERTLHALQEFQGLPVNRDAIVELLCADFAALSSQRTVLVLDDYHTVDEAVDVRYVLMRLIKNAPEDVAFLLAARGRPSLPLARVSAQGRLAELDTTALRFSRDETHELFRATYDRGLDGSLVDEIDQRTEGWAACLRLVQSSIRDRSDSEIHAFVRDLSGAKGPIYDFLAQEVLGGLSPPVQRLTLFASLLDHIVPAYLAAMLWRDPQPPTGQEIEAWLDAAEALGLLTRSGEMPGSTRFHPLMRGFLRRQLAEELSANEIKDLHLRVAEAAGGDDWITACTHFIAGGEPAQAATVLGGSAIEALGTGRWRTAAEMLGRIRALDGTATDSTAAVLTAFQDIEDRRLDQVIDALTVVDLPTAAPVTRALIRHALYRAYWRRGESKELSAIINAVLEDCETPEIFRDIARLHPMVYDEDGNTSFAELSRGLLEAADRQSKSGMFFFASVSLHNAMVVEYSRANYSQAVKLGRRALEMYGRTGTASREVQATHAFLARCYAELGAGQEAEHFDVAIAEPVLDPNALSDGAFLAANQGRQETAVRLCASLVRVQLEQPMFGITRSLALIAQAATHLGAGDHAAAIDCLTSGVTRHRGIATELTATTILALARAAAGEAETAAAVAAAALGRAHGQGVRHLEVRLAVLHAAANGDAKGLQHAVQAAAATGRLALADMADAIGPAMHLIDPVPEEIHRSIEWFPDRWLPVLRRQLENGLTPAAYSCASLLELFGTVSDVPRLRAFERTYLRGVKPGGLGRPLIRRVSPGLWIFDLGPSSLKIGERALGFAGMRRKSASLLAFLITRRRNAATRDQVLDALWPDLDPASASNSLNQTMYFLRRDFDPWYDDDLSMDYVHAEGDMVWVDPEKVSIASVEFDRLASLAISNADLDLPLARAAVERYAGRFCPEFEYEEWSSAWRDRLHASYLHLILETDKALVAEGRLSEAAAIVQRGVAVDPEAVELEGNLVWLYAQLGSHAAAAEQYAHYAKSHRDQLGVDAPSIGDLVGRGRAAS